MVSFFFEKNMLDIKIKKITELGITPTKNDGDAGYDLYSIEDYTLQPLERRLFKTNIALEIPTGYYGKICDRSGKALKNGLHVMAGTIDSTYRGDIGIVLINLSGLPLFLEYILSYLSKMFPNTASYFGEHVLIAKGDKIAQIVFRKYEDATFVEEDLSETERAEKGFGSSGN